MRKRIMLLMAVASLVMMPMARADEAADVAELKAQVQALIEANQALNARVEDLEKKLGAQETAPAPVPQTPEAPEAAPAEEEGTDLRVYWKEGLHFDSKDGAFQLKLGGRLNYDVAFFDNPDYWSLGGEDVDEHDGTELRRLRLGLQGIIYDDYFFEFEADFADNEVEIADAFVGARQVPVVGTLRAGHFFEPIGLESETGSNDTTFMERAMVTEALLPSRSLGVGFARGLLDERLLVSGGVFNGGENKDNYWIYTARVSGLPWYGDEGRRLLHLGAAYSRRNPESDYTFRARPGSHQANRHLDTGPLPVDDIDLWAAEAALVLGPFSVQGEFARADASFMAEPRDVTFFDIAREFRLGDRHFDGYYVEASYFLTGEHRPYDTQYGVFGRVIPRNNLRLKGPGWGAWQIAVRYDELSLDDYDFRSGVIGGVGRNWTIGLNWHLNPNTKLMFNYVNADIDQYAYEGSMDIYQARFQVEF